MGVLDLSNRTDWLLCDPKCAYPTVYWGATFDGLRTQSEQERINLCAELAITASADDALNLVMESLGFSNAARQQYDSFLGYWPAISFTKEIVVEALRLALSRAVLANVPIASVWRPHGKADEFFVQVVTLPGCVLMETITPPAPEPNARGGKAYLGDVLDAWIVATDSQVNAIKDLHGEYGYTDQTMGTSNTGVARIRLRKS